jgi:thiol-disulfide isomerase/thioredoxin
MKCRWRIAQRLRRNMHATEVPESGALPGGLVLLNLYADWHPPCADMNQVFQELSRTWPALLYYQCQAEEFPEMAETLEISSVPTFVVLKVCTVDRHIPDRQDME